MLFCLVFLVCLCRSKRGLRAAYGAQIGAVAVSTAVSRLSGASKFLGGLALVLLQLFSRATSDSTSYS